MQTLSAHACPSIRASDWGARSSPVEAAINDISLHDRSGGAGSANTVRARSGNAEGPSGSHYIIRPLQKATGPRKKTNRDVSFLGHAPSGMCTTLLGGYWGVLGPDFRTVGPKRRPRAQNGARPQPGLCQGGRNVGYKSACHVLETTPDGSRRRPDSTSCSPLLKQATRRSEPRKIDAARTT